MCFDRPNDHLAAKLPDICIIAIIIFLMFRYLESLDPAVFTDLSQTYQSLVCDDTSCICLIKTHDSESRGQEEAGGTRQTSELFTGSTVLKLENSLNKPP